MRNMSYCRNRNTLDDLRDVRENLHRPTNDDEKKAFLRIIDECAQILGELGIDIDDKDIMDAKETAKCFRTTDEIELGE